MDQVYCMTQGIKSLAKECVHHSDMLNTKRGNIEAGLTHTARKDTRDETWSAQVTRELLRVFRMSRTKNLFESS